MKARSLSTAFAWLAVELCALVVVLLHASVVRGAAAQSSASVARSASAPTEIVQLGLMPDELRESSGLGVSRSYPGVFWTHNDSGDRPRLYAIDSSASLLATIDVEGAGARDWEAMALGRCPSRANSCLYVADIGDNRSTRASVVIYVVEEPDPYLGDGAVPLVGTVRFAYPDSPHDAESLAVTPGGDLVIVTKERWRATRVFEIAARDIIRAIDGGGPLTLGEARELPILPDRNALRYATGATLDADGAVLAVRTYSEIHFFHWPLGDRPRQAAAVCSLGNGEPQGEAIAFREDGWLALTSESHTGRPGLLQIVRCRE